jgi:hypothetical protein
MVSDHAARTYHRVVSDFHTAQNVRSTANPVIAIEGYGASEFKTSAALRCIVSMIGRVYRG